jgi:integrase
MAEYKPMSDLSGYLTYAQIKRLFKFCHSDRDKALFLTLFYSGRRVSEVVRSLKPKDIDFDENMIIWRIRKKKPRKRDEETGKFNRHKTPPVKKIKAAHPKLIKALQAYIRGAHIGDESYVFPITTRRVRQIFTRLAKDSGIETVGEKPLHPHHMRHSFAIEAAKKISTPEGLVLLQKALDHSSIQTTMFYLQFAPREQKKLLEEMWK